MRLRTKIILLFNLICWTLIIGFALYISYFTRDSLRTKFFHRLEENAKIVGKHTVEKAEHINELYYEVMRPYLRQLTEGKDYIIRIAKGDKQVNTKPDLPVPADFYQEVISSGQAQYMDRDTAYFALYFQGPPAEKDLIIISSGRDDYGLGEQVSLDRTLINAGLFSIVIVALISYLFARHIIKPIATINKEIDKISISNLNLRLEKPNQVNDEVSMLVDSFNDMISRLELSVKSQKSFIANASHSFRTPLTIIKGEAELTLRDKSLGDESIKSLKNIIAETDSIISMINNLLMIARSGLEDSKKDYHVVRIDEVLFKVISSERQAEDYQSIHLDFEAMPEDSSLMEVYGNFNLLFIALSNIVSNACKYGKDLDVRISLSSVRNNVIINIQDQGIGIPDQEQKFVYDSFYRASNVQNIHGTGLGLLLAKNIIDLHDGDLILHSKEGEGTHVRVVLPGNKTF
ncbi:ATPase/histidine kinase/DNA gyrase B/HSP90 domain protein [Sphingobacterium spiritivorum ATCC 33300]|uniref:histidine kinase n=1 Tax=Sphingobacterium spiritivorum ATCC 33300 TaxID=525372 RepID=C2FXK0_SPHSI|nr:HAMP domain-containing sensor histidine kinase [Sphingobacterium spiritivorum]EEI92441.1 ATPase/histidine kinase/DNA gyrase B/HSP90 domain protein [Sphingobacterium spiritivorum ATCC 33300]QQS96813.1 HAMP domain-containing histidine kinase [Sphingobacterium spiritivorum]